MMYELMAEYDTRQSFYHKAIVKETKSGTELYSYETKVAEIKNGKPKIFGWYSNTTTRHINEYLKQNGFNPKDFR